MRKRILAVAVAAATLASGANAAGFYLKELSITGQGRAFAGEVTNTEDASAVYFNPAATAYMTESNTLSFGAHALAPNSTLKNTGSLVTNGTNTNLAASNAETKNPYGTSLIPNIYATLPLDNGAVLGFGVNNPFGLSNKYEKDSFVRYDSIETELKTPSLNFSVAKHVSDKLSIGFGIEAQKGEAVLESALPLSAGISGFVPGGSSNTYSQGDIIGDINSRLTAEGSFELAPFFGLTYAVAEYTSLGFSYRAGIDHKANGSVLLTPNTSSEADGDAFEATITSLALGQGAGASAPAIALAARNAGSYTIENASAELSTPSIATVGLKHSINDQTRVYADATYYGWSAFDDIKITTSVETLSPQKYKDTISIGLGMEHDYSASFTGRAGIMIDPTPTNDDYRSARTPDADRLWLAVGGSYSVLDNMSLDFAFTHIMLDDVVLDQAKALTLAGTPIGQANIKASGSPDVNILSLGLRYKF
ncbi:OmpP1/FadL family transporter [Litorivicinus lipolyticus]|uniref:OmpP1/FadL family transporter n=1 Tax=Litorivicinus lipolyticus TaxID=418701 RepID=UPI003B58B9DC